MLRSSTRPQTESKHDKSEAKHLSQPEETDEEPINLPVKDTTPHEKRQSTDLEVI